MATRTKKNAEQDAAAALAAAKDNLAKAEVAAESAQAKLDQLRQEQVHDPGNEVLADQIIRAESMVTGYNGQVGWRRQELETVQHRHQDVHARAVVARQEVDPALTNETYRAIVGEFETKYAELVAASSAKLRALDDRRAELCQEAIDAGLPSTPEGWRPIPGDPAVTAAGEPLRAVPQYGTVVLPGMRAYPRKTPGAVLRAVVDGELCSSDISTFEAAPIEDAVPEEHAQRARELLSEVYGLPVLPMTALDPLGDDHGVWCRIDQADTEGPETRISAYVVLRGVPAAKAHPAHRDPRQHGAVLVTSWTAKGSTVTATISDPRLGTGEISDVSIAVSRALREVEPEEWPEQMAKAVMFNATLGAVAKATDDGVVVRWTVHRDHVPQLGDWLLPGTVVTKALTGLAVPGWGVIRQVEMREGGAAALLAFNVEQPEQAA